MEGNSKVGQPAKGQEDFQQIFDLNWDLANQIKEYDSVEAEFKKNKLKYKEKWLKRAIIYDNQLDPEMEKNMKKQKERYPDPQELLIHNPYAEPKAAKGKKKKKKK